VGLEATAVSLTVTLGESGGRMVQVGQGRKSVTTQKNQLYYGDNYEVLQRYVKDESVDLVYLDPPFNSRQDYNVLFAEKDGSQSSSQIHAFEDTWEWNMVVRIDAA